MDDASIDVAVVSLSTPGVHTGNNAKARALARRCNEFAADLVGAWPDRFASLACLPLPDIDASLDELAYAIDVLDLDGVVLFTNANGSQVLYGTDFPYLRRDLAVGSRQRLLESQALNEAERGGVLGSNASDLFPRLHHQPAP
jgi:predicted TIM-barrel fold metal-dependent hydrolase